MLIDTKQIIPKTEFRHKLNSLIEEVKEGKTFVISDRGQIVAIISPSWKMEKQETTKNIDLLSETVKLAEIIDKTASRWNTLTALKITRSQRVKYLRRN